MKQKWKKTVFPMFAAAAMAAVLLASPVRAEETGDPPDETILSDSEEEREADSKQQIKPETYQQEKETDNMEKTSGKPAGEQSLAAVSGEGQGSITVQLEETEKKLPRKDVSFVCTKVADVENGSFVLTEDFQDTEVDLNQIENANQLELAAETLEKKTAGKADTIRYTDENGTVKIDGLENGVYLVYAADIAGYENISPFLVSLPTFDETKGEMMMDVEILPKHTPLPEPEKKTVPKTGVEDKTTNYTVMALAFLTGAVILSAILAGGRKKEKQE